ncbi:HERV-H LTR-associating protein 2 [Echinops telfairi]|uniref:HERV-H LTR-associating protein 2 n=1 Tax=Echinops telfairi TaxID=9371 RepID=A0ABM0ZRB6_ECHTE|nr:HERV-H LTR-associating protein 2 [Echinops telfairi]
MKAEVVLPFLFVLMPSLRGLQDFVNYFLDATHEETVIGRLNDNIVLPCLFESGPEVVIHWKILNYYVHSFYKDRDQLEKQNVRYANRTSLFDSKICSGNASVSLRRLSFQDEGIYICYVGTSDGQTTNKVVLKVGAFLGPVIEYDLGNTSIFLTCSLTAYPQPTITWQVDNTTVSGRTVKGRGPLPLFDMISTLNITDYHKSYECIIENPLLKQTWTGRWTMRENVHKLRNEAISLPCQLDHTFSLSNQDFVVTWSRIKNDTSSVLAYFNSSQSTIIKDSRFSWNQLPRIQRDFSLTLKVVHLSDSGDYLCNISSSKYSLLTVNRLYIDASASYEPDTQEYRDLIIAISVILPLLIASAGLVFKYRHRICISRNNDPTTVPEPEEQPADRTAEKKGTELTKQLVDLNISIHDLYFLYGLDTMSFLCIDPRLPSHSLASAAFKVMNCKTIEFAAAIGETA